MIDKLTKPCYDESKTMEITRIKLEFDKMPFMLTLANFSVFYTSHRYCVAHYGIRVWAQWWEEV
jgi:hypothetical protein